MNSLNSTMHFEVVDCDENLQICRGVQCVNGFVVTNDYNVDDGIPDNNPECTYDAFTKSGSFLTSTALDESDCADDIDLVNMDDVKDDGHEEGIWSKVLSLEANIGAFFQSIQQDLDAVKQDLLNGRTIENAPMDNLCDIVIESPNRQDADLANAAPVQIVSVVETYESIGGNSILGGANTTFIASPVTLNEMFVTTPKTLSAFNETLIISTSDNVPKTGEQVTEAMPENSDEEIEDPVQKSLRLPCNSLPEYDANEDILELDEDAEKDLIRKLMPLENESETEYINRTVFVVFTKYFLLKHVSWKKENDRRNLKHGNLLKTWKECHETRFDPDEKYQRFQYHIRRLKSSKRAVDKRRLEQQKPIPKKRKSGGQRK